MRIAHLADLHIRTLSRHQEYSEVFEKLYASLREKQVDRIVIAGDLVHSKLNLSPELISFLVEVLSNLLDIAEVDIIAGNHDINSSNIGRLDALSPLISLIRETNPKNALNYYTKTGVYLIHDNFSYGVYSIFDGHGPVITNRRDDHVYIALFHGSLLGAHYNNNMIITDSRYSSESFFDFDFVMLGDLHEQQFIGSKRIAYCGSLIQQDFGEESEKGYLLWDIKTKDDFEVEFVHIPNDYGFYTINIEENNLPDLQFPSKSALRIISNVETPKISKKFIDDLIVAAKLKYKVYSVRLDLKPIIVGNDNIKYIIDSTSKLNDKELLCDWLNREGVKEDEIVKILDIDSSLQQSINSTNDGDSFSFTTWEINRLYIDNFLSYTRPTVINFDNLDGIVGLFGENGSGKSALIDAILYALFNKTTRNVRNDDYISKFSNRNECTVELLLTISNFNYKITRRSYRIIKKRSGELYFTKTELNLQRKTIDSDEWEELNESQRTDTEKLIRSVIGSYEEFLTVSLYSYNSGYDFISLPPFQKTDYILKYLGLDRFQKKYDEANKILKDLEYAKKLQTLGEDEKTLEDLRIKLSELEKSLESAKELKTGVQNEVEQLKSTINHYRGMNSGAIYSEEDDIETIESDISKCQAEIDGLKLKVDKIVNENRQVDTVAHTIVVDAMKERITDLLQLSSKLSTVKMDLDHQIKMRDSHQISIDELKADLSDGCKMWLDHNDCRCKESTTIQSKQEKLLYFEELITSKNLKIEETRNQVIDIEKKIAILPELREKFLDSKAVIDQYESRIQMGESYNEKIALKSKSLELLTKKREFVRANLQLIQDRAKREHEIIQLTTECRNKEQELEKHEKRVNGISSDIVLSNERITNLESLLKSREELSRKTELYEKYCSAIHRDGIPLYLLREMIPAVNFDINEMLNSVVDFGVYFTVNDNEDIELVMRSNSRDDSATGDDTRPISMASGMEKLFINLCVRAVLLKNSKISRSNIYWIDEGFGVLDSSNIHSIKEIFDILKKYFKKIVFVTHIDQLKDIGNHSIIVHKDEKIGSILSEYL